jgi:hypothetical protein
VNHPITTLVVISIILGAVTATSLGWRYAARIRHDSTGPRWRSAATILALVLVTFSALLLAAYLTRNAVIGGDGNGSWTTLIFIRTGNYLSLAGALISLIAKGKARWPAFVGGCLMLFIWFSQGMSL